MTYQKIEQGHPAYERIEANKKDGHWICDSTDHNDIDGCSNPECFNYKQGALPFWKNYAEKFKL